MPSKGKPTVTQKQKKFQNNGMVHPDAYLGDDIRNRYVDSARILELNGNWQESLAIRIFGPTLMGSIAFALDNLAQFKNSFRKISKPTRQVLHGRHVLETHQNVSRVTRVYRNYVFFDDDPPELVPEYFVEEYTEEFKYDPLGDFGISDYFGEHVTLQVDEFQADSTQKQRFKGQEAGTLQRLKKVEGNWSQHLYVTKGTLMDYTFSGTIDGVESNLYYDRYYTVETVSTVGAIAVPAEWVYFNPDPSVLASSQVALSKRIASYYVSDFVVKCLANRQFFKAFYQIGELSDLPKMVRNLNDLLRFFQKSILSPLAQLRTLDKDFANLYLGYKFGYESVASAVKDLLKTPERIAKHMNYVLRKNNKVSVGKFGKIFPNYPPDSSYAEDPVFLSFSPFGLDIISTVDSFTAENEVRCSVNQTLAFPPVMVPKFSDTNYRDFIGLNPTIVDWYNLIPFTWLFDWYTGVGSYLNMMRQTIDDRFLINFGFMTVILRPKAKSIVECELYDSLTTLSWDGSVDTLRSNIRPIVFINEYSYEFTHRMDIADLDGASPVASVLKNLTDGQTKILGALLTKFT